MTNAAVALEHAVARNIRDLRVAREWSQADLASYMRVNGFPWQPNRVAQVETLRRPVTTLELAGLTWVFGVPVTDLLAGDDDVTLPDGGSVPLTRIREALSGAVGRTVNRTTVRRPSGAGQTDEEVRKIAARLSVSTPLVNWLAQRMWGQSFAAERDRRAGDLTGLSSRSAQTKRGHATRALISEASAYLDEHGRAALERARNQEVRQELRRMKEGRS